jgi:chloramphenicol O-acetyltransferase type A
MSEFIDLDKWKRREHFQIFSRLANPFWSVCADVDVTRLRQECHENKGQSFSLAAIFLALAAVNETEAFRLRIRGQRVWLHDSVGVSTTVPRRDETFGFAVIEMAGSVDDFQTQARVRTAAAKDNRSLGPSIGDRDDLIYHSTLPWIRFTALSNPTGGGQDSIPRIVFGRYTEEGGRWRMPVSVEVHHALVDGLDVARFFERFERGLSGPPPLACPTPSRYSE